MTLYNIFLTLHSIMRWVVLIAGIIAVVQAFRGWRKATFWTPGDERLGMIYTMSMDLQVLLGLVLFFILSPITRAALSGMSSAMQNEVTRFFLVEHFPVMLVAVVIAHIGRARARKATDDAGKHRTEFIFYAISLVLVILAIPWPFMAYGRPLL